MLSSRDAYPFAAEVYSGFEDESEYQEWLVEVFERFGWSTWTEVQSKDRKARADLVVRKEPWGSIGIELKYKEKLTPRYWAEAFEQLSVYKEKSFGLDIGNWAVGGDQSNLEDQRGRGARRGMAIAKEFYNYFGYGFLSTQTRLEVIYNNSNPVVKIPIANIHYERGEITPPSQQTYERYQTEEAVEYVKNQDCGVFA